MAPNDPNNQRKVQKLLFSSVRPRHRAKLRKRTISPAEIIYNANLAIDALVLYAHALMQLRQSFDFTPLW